MYPKSVRKIMRLYHRFTITRNEYGKVGSYLSVHRSERKTNSTLTVLLKNVSWNKITTRICVWYFILIHSSRLNCLFKKSTYSLIEFCMYRMSHVSTDKLCQRVWELILSKRCYVQYESIRLRFSDMKGKVV